MMLDLTYIPSGYVKIAVEKYGVYFIVVESHLVMTNIFIIIQWDSDSLGY